LIFDAATAVGKDNAHRPRAEFQMAFSRALKDVPGDPPAKPRELPSHLIVPFIFSALHPDLRQPLARANVLQ
jgi:hypothetical protein